MLTRIWKKPTESASPKLRFFTPDSTSAAITGSSGGSPAFSARLASHFASASWLALFPGVVGGHVGEVGRRAGRDVGGRGRGRRGCGGGRGVGGGGGGGGRGGHGGRRRLGGAVLRGGDRGEDARVARRVLGAGRPDEAGAVAVRRLDAVADHAVRAGRAARGVGGRALLAAVEQPRGQLLGLGRLLRGDRLEHAAAGLARGGGVALDGGLGGGDGGGIGAGRPRCGATAAGAAPTPASKRRPPVNCSL